MKRGLSTIVATLIIILLVLVAVGVIWVVIRNVIQEGTEQVSLGKFTLDLDLKQVQTIDNDTISVTVKRNAGLGEFVSLVFIIDDGVNTETVTINTTLQELEQRTFTIDLQNILSSNIKKISLAPIFRLTSGKEVIGDVKDTLNVGSGTSQCSASCGSLGYECGTNTVCGQQVDCSGGQTCEDLYGTGYVCSGGTCVDQSSCTDDCASLGYECGTHTICGVDTNCGDTATVCVFPNAQPTCNAGQCEILSCNSNYGNCDGNEVNGCEADLTTNATCGSCLVSCDTEALETCSGGTCVAPTPPSNCGDSTCDTGECSTCAQDCTHSDCCPDGSCNNGELCGDDDVDPYCNSDCGACLSGNVFYVSNSGSDSADGTSPATAWQTINHVNSQSFNPGDTILFRRGDTWREQLIIGDSGSSNAWITYGAYGSGDKPRIVGSIQATGWTNVAGNVWSSSTSVPLNPYTISYSSQIFFEEIGGDSAFWGRYRTYDASFSQLTQEYDWTWNGGTLYVYSPTDPNTRYGAVEAPQREYGVSLTGHEYLVFDNLDIQYLVSAGIYETYGTIGRNGLNVTNSEIAYIGVKNSARAFGLSVTSSNAYYAYNEIHDCGRRAISINLYDTTPVGTMQNILVEHNHFYHGFHTTGIDCINSGGHTIDNLIIRNNYIEGDTNVLLGGVNPNSNGLQLADQSGGPGTVRNIYVYNNVFTYSHGKGVQVEALENVYVVFNTFYTWNPTLTTGQPAINLASSGSTDALIMNNLLYSDIPESQNGGLPLLFVACPELHSNHIIDYNLYYAEDPAVQITEIYQAVGLGCGPYFDHEYTMAAWETYKSDHFPYDANSPTPGDPLFVNPANEDDFTLQAGSPAIDAGTPISWITTDYNGNVRDPTHPTIGAFEY